MQLASILKFSLLISMLQLLVGFSFALLSSHLESLEINVTLCILGVTFVVELFCFTLMIKNSSGLQLINGIFVVCIVVFSPILIELLLLNKINLNNLQANVASLLLAYLVAIFLKILLPQSDSENTF